MILGNAWVLTCDDAGTEHELGWIRIADGLVAELGAGDAPAGAEDLAGAVDDDDASAAVRQPSHGGGHRRVVHPDDDHVVRVVCDRRRERAAPQAESTHEAEPDAARAEMALDDRDLGEVALGIR